VYRYSNTTTDERKMGVSPVQDKNPDRVARISGGIRMKNRRFSRVGGTPQTIRAPVVDHPTTDFRWYAAGRSGEQAHR
jgi:hypothetical protein